MIQMTRDRCRSSDTNSHTKIRANIRVRQLGFAFIDVLVASLVLAIGVLGFFTLTNMSLQQAQTNKYRLQALGVANTFVEMARANPYWLLSMVPVDDVVAAYVTEAAVTDGPVTPTSIDNSGNSAVATQVCDQKNVADSASWCAPDSSTLMNDLRAYFQTFFFDSFQNVPGKAVVCLAKKSVATGVSIPLRVVVIWKNATPHVGFQAAEASDCPSNYDARIPLADYDSSVQGAEERINPDRGYIEIFTRI